MRDTMSNMESWAWQMLDMTPTDPKFFFEMQLSPPSLSARLKKQTASMTIDMMTNAAWVCLSIQFLLITFKSKRFFVFERIKCDWYWPKSISHREGVRIQDCHIPSATTGVLRAIVKGWTVSFKASNALEIGSKVSPIEKASLWMSHMLTVYPVASSSSWKKL